VALKASNIGTYGSGTSFFQLLSVDVNNLSLGKSQETVTQMFNEVSGATATNKIYDLGAPVGVIGRVNEKLIARTLNSAALASALLKVNGYMQRVGPTTNQ
jgi:hypothetical protein